MKLFVGVIVVAIIILAVLLALNLIFSLDEEKTVDGFDFDIRTPKGFSYTPESEMKDVESMNDTKNILDSYVILD